jgi:hypothetical protein
MQALDNAKPAAAHTTSGMWSVGQLAVHLEMNPVVHTPRDLQQMLLAICTGQNSTATV